MTVIERWTIYVTTNPNGTREPVRQPGAKEAERFRFAPVEVVPADQLAGAVETLRELLPWAEGILPDDDVAEYNALLDRARAIVGGQ